MTGDGNATQELVERLVGDLRPVRRLPPLRALVGISLGAAAVVGAGVLAIYSPKPGLRESLASDPIYDAVLIGLVLAVLGGCLAALASAIPGRESVLRVASGAGIGGLLLAVGASALGTPLADGGLSAVGPRDAMCIVRGVAFGALPAVVVFLSAARGWSGRPASTVAWTLVGSGAAGALFVHLTCAAAHPAHLLCAHSATPLLLTAALTAALAPLMRRMAR